MIHIRCRKCNSAVEEDWSFCPSCGMKIPSKAAGINVFNIGLEDIFNKFMSKGIEEAMRSIAELEQENDSWNPARGRTARGMTVKIVQSGNMPPVIKVERFEDGLVNISRVETSGNAPDILNDAEISASKGARAMPECDAPAENHAKKMPKAIEEPKVNITRLPRKLIIEAELPGVKSSNDIAVAELAESLEMRAFADDKTYMKILQIPPEMHIAGKTFSGDKLTIELCRGKMRCCCTRGCRQAPLNELI